MDEQKVLVRRQWNHWADAAVPLNKLEGLHWSDISGGVAVRSPRPFVHAYISCREIDDSDFGHSCRHGQGPHRIKVCVTKTVNLALWPEIMRRLDSRQ